MAGETGRIRAVHRDMPLDAGRVENRLDPPSQSPCCFVFRQPNRGEDALDVLRRNLIDALVSDLRRVNRERHPPLSAMLLIFPTGFHCGDEAVGKGSKKGNDCFDLSRVVLGGVLLEWIAALPQGHPCRFRLGARLGRGEAVWAGAAQAHLSLLAVRPEDHDELPRSRLAGAQIEIFAIAMQTRRQADGLLGCQFMSRFRHAGSPLPAWAPKRRDDPCRYSGIRRGSRLLGKPHKIIDVPLPAILGDTGEKRVLAETVGFEPTIEFPL